MLTRLILKVSLLAAFATFIYCLLTNVSLQSSTSRALIVFAGFFAVLIAFLLTLRLVFEPVEKQKAVDLPAVEPEETEQEEMTELERIELESLAETMGVVSEQ